MPLRPAPASLLAGLFLFALFATPVVALDWTVDISADENDASCAVGDCSLREAIAAADDGDNILFALPGSPPWTITLTGALQQLSLAHDVTIAGPGAAQLAISGANLVRVMTVQAGVNVTLSGLTLRNGETKSSGDKHGGCLKVLGNAFVSSVRFESCQAWNGGITSNTAGGDGGGVYVAAGGSFHADLLVFATDAAGVGGGAASPPTVFAGGRGGALANAGFTRLFHSSVIGCTSGAGGGPFGPGGDGGGVANLAGGVLHLDTSTLSGNRSGDGATFMSTSGPDGRGGGIYCEADCTLNNVTLSGNAIGTSAVGGVAQGGGLMVVGGTTRLSNVTVAGNTANSTGGGIARSGGTIRPRNSLFAGNTGGSSPDCASATAGVMSGGHNLIRINNGCVNSFTGTDQEGTSATPLEPLLAALAANGGPTETRALGAGSPAIDHGDAAGCLMWDPILVSDLLMNADQRDEPRPTDGDGDTVSTCDVGAFELAAVPPVLHVLDVTLAGGGSGTVTSQPAGISCPGDCTESWVASQNVELSAAPDAGSFFAGWSGACTGSGTCSFTMADDRAVTATFGRLRTLDVTLAGGGTGTVTSAPAGIACPGDCSEVYGDGTAVTLTATPAVGSFFVGWSGDCAGNGTCQPALDADRAVRATFGSLLVFSDGFDSGDPCDWSANVGGTACPP